MVKRRPTLRLKSHTAARFNEKQLKEFKLAFAAIDKERTGKIGLGELMDAFKTLGMDNITIEYVVENMLDGDKDLQITQTFFVSRLSQLMNDISDEDLLLNLFSNFDSEDEGSIDLNYFIDIVTNHGKNKLSAEEVGI